MGIADPAWFYSSLAQTSAAIVGLIGGLLVSRLIDHGAALRVRRRDIEQAAAAAKATIQDAVGNWQDAIQGFKEAVAELKREAEEGSTRSAKQGPFGIPSLELPTVALLSSREDWGFGGDSGLSMDDPIEYLRHAVDMSAQLKIALGASPPMTGRLSAVDLSTAAVSRRQAARRISDKEGIRLLEKHAELLEGLARQLTALRDQLLPKSLAVIAALLLWLAMTGVFWPLEAVLPGLEGSSKGLMLASLAFGLVGLNAYVAYELRALRRVGVIRWEDL